MTINQSMAIHKKVESETDVTSGIDSSFLIEEQELLTTRA
jgi:hypothetical protein